MASRHQGVSRDGTHSVDPGGTSAGVDGTAANPTAEKERIPRLESVTPAIFVPLEQVLLEQLDAPRDKTQRLKLTLERLDAYSEQVKRNIIFMFLRERDRLLQQLRIDEGAQGDQALSGGSIQQWEFDAMARNATAPPVSGRDYTMAHHIPPAPSSRGYAVTPRDHAIEELLDMIEGAVNNLKGFTGMATNERQQYEQALEKEQAAESR